MEKLRQCVKDSVITEESEKEESVCGRKRESIRRERRRKNGEVEDWRQELREKGKTKQGERRKKDK